MRHGRASGVVMALCFLGQAGNAHAGEAVEVEVLSPGDGDDEGTLAAADTASLGAVTVEFGLAAPTGELLLTDEIVEAGAAGAEAAEPLLGDEAIFADPLFGGAAAGPGDAAAAAAASPGGAAIFAAGGGVERVSDAELSEQRGGFVYQGLDIRLGAEMRSYIGDEMVVQTNFSWTDSTVAIERMVSTALTPGALAGLQAGMLNGAGLNLRAADDAVFFANGGQTAFIQRAEGAIQNIIVNSASNVAIRQEIEAELDIGNFAPFQSGLLGDRVASALASMAASSLVGGMTR